MKTLMIPLVLLSACGGCREPAEDEPAEAGDEGGGGGEDTDIPDTTDPDDTSPGNDTGDTAPADDTGPGTPLSAALVCDATLTATGTATLSAAGSIGDGLLSYAWTTTLAPTGHHDDPTGTDVEAEIELFLVGSYAFQVTVSDASGATATATCAVEVSAPDGLYVELAWEVPDSDLDLHYSQEGTALYEKPGDCCWCNPDPTWGAQEGSDPEVLLDSTTTGPEAIQHPAPEGDTYTVSVHAFYVDDTPVEALVNIWWSGAVLWSGSREVAHNAVWTVGEVSISDETFTESSEANAESEARDCY